VDEFIERGRALREGEVVDAEIAVTRRGEIQAIPVARPGSMSTGHKPVPVRGETTIRFDDPSPALRAELDRIVELAKDPDLQRKNRGWAPASITIEIESGVYTDCAISRPLNPYGPTLDLDYGLTHEDL
jgi:hypothetical protein